jgi:hypothetical protein
VIAPSVEEVQDEPSLRRRPTAGFRTTESQSRIEPTRARDIAPAFLTDSKALQDEMAAQLADMAAQLRRNAVHFRDSLVEDNAVLRDAQEKLEYNAVTMEKEQGRLKVHSSKSRGTTWLVIAIVVTVSVLWAVMFVVIRLT